MPDAINTALERITKMTGNVEGGPNLEEIARQRRDVPYYEYLQRQFVNGHDGILSTLRGGAWANAANIEEENKYISDNAEARRVIHRNAMERIRLSEQLMISQNLPNRELLRDQLQQAIVLLDELLTAEEYRMVVMQEFLRNVRDVVAQLRLLPQGEARDAFFKQNLTGANNVLLRLQNQISDMDETLRLTTTIYSLNQTLAARATEFTEPGRASRLKVLNDMQTRLSETRDARRKRLQPPPPTDINYAHLDAAIAAIQAHRTAVEAYGKDASEVNRKTFEATRDALVTALETCRVPLEFHLSRIPNDSLVYLQVPTSRPLIPGAQGDTIAAQASRLLAFIETTDVDSPLSMAFVPDGTANSVPNTAVGSLLLGIQIARHRDIARRQRVLITPRDITEEAVKQVSALEDERIALLNGFFVSSDDLSNRNFNIQRLLSEGRHIGADFEFMDANEIAAMRRTRRYLQTDAAARERFRVIGREIHVQGRTTLGVTPAGRQLLVKALRDISEPAAKLPGNNGLPGYVVPDSLANLDNGGPNGFSPARILSLLGIVTAWTPNWMLNRTTDIRLFTPDELTKLTVTGTYLRSPAGTVTHHALQRLVFDLHRAANPEERTKRLQEIRALIQGVNAPNAFRFADTDRGENEEMAIVAVLEILDVSNAIMFRYRHTDIYRAHILEARRTNLRNMRRYMREWREQVRKNGLNFNADALAQHLLTMRTLDGFQAITTRITPELSGLEQDLAHSPLRVGWDPVLPSWLANRGADDVFWAQNVLPSGLLSRVSGGHWGYNASQARIDGHIGIPFFGNPGILTAHPSLMRFIGAALIPPADLGLTTAEQVREWREKEVKRLQEIARGDGAGTEARKKASAALQAALEVHFNDRTRFAESVIAINNQFNPRIVGASCRLDALLGVREALLRVPEQAPGGPPPPASNIWRPDDLITTRTSRQPAWWTGIPPNLAEDDQAREKQIEAWRNSLAGNMAKDEAHVKDPANAEGIRKREEAKWVYDELERLAGLEQTAFLTAKREYTMELSQNFRAHINIAMMRFTRGNIAANDWMLLGMIGVEGVATLATLWYLGGAGGIRSMPGWGRPLRPLNNPNSGFFQGLINAPGRMANSLTRPFVGAYDWLRPGRVTIDAVQAQQRVKDAGVIQGRLLTYMRMFRRVPTLCAAEEAAMFQYEVRLAFQQLSNLEAGLQEGSAELQQLRFIRATLTQRYLRSLIRIYAGDNAALAAQLQALMRGGALTPEVEAAVWAAHRAGSVAEKNRILRAAGVPVEIIHMLLDGGACGERVLVNGVSANVIQRLPGFAQSPFLQRLAGLAGSTANAERAAALAVVSRHPQLMASLAEWEGPAFTRAIQLLGQSEMAGLNTSRLNAETASRLVRFLAEGGTNEIRAFINLADRTKELAIRLHPAELTRLLGACNESAHIRVALATIQDVIALGRFSRHAQVLTAAEMGTLSAARAARLVEILSGAEAAQFVTRLETLGGHAERTAFINSMTRPRLGVAQGAFATIAVAGELFILGTDIHQHMQEVEARRTCVDSMRRLLMPERPAPQPGQPALRPHPFTEGTAGNGDIIFTHTLTGTTINVSLLIREASARMGTNWMRYATDGIAFIGAVCGFIPVWGWAVTIGTFIITTPMRQGLNDDDAQRYAELYADLPPAFLAFVPSTVFFGANRANFQMFLQMREAHDRIRRTDLEFGDFRDWITGPAIDATFGPLMRLRDGMAGLGGNNKERVARMRELTDDGMDRVLMHCFTQEIIQRQNFPLDVLAVRDANGTVTRQAVDVLWQDRRFLRQVFEHFLTERNVIEYVITDTWQSKFDEAITNTVQYYLRCKFIQQFRNRATALEPHEKALAQLTKQLTPHFAAAPVGRGLLEQMTTIQHVITAIGTDAPAAAGWRALAGLAPTAALGTPPQTSGLVEVIEGWRLQEEIIPLLRAIGALPDADRGHLVRVLELLSRQQRAGLLRSFLNPALRPEIIKICAQQIPGLRTARASMELRGQRDFYGSSFIGSRTLTIADASQLLAADRGGWIHGLRLPNPEGDRALTADDVTFNYQQAQSNRHFLADRVRVPRTGLRDAMGTMIVRLGGRPIRIGLSADRRTYTEITDPNQPAIAGWTLLTNGRTLYFMELDGRAYWTQHGHVGWDRITDGRMIEQAQAANPQNLILGAMAQRLLNPQNPAAAIEQQIIGNPQNPPAPPPPPDAVAVAVNRVANGIAQLRDNMAIGENPNGSAILAAVQMRLLARGARIRFEHGFTWFDVPAFPPNQATVVSYGWFGGRFYVALPGNAAWQRVSASITWPAGLAGRERFQQITENVRDIEQGLDPEYAMTNWITNAASRGPTAPPNVTGGFVGMEPIGRITGGRGRAGQEEPPPTLNGVPLANERVAVYRLSVPYVPRGSRTPSESAEMFCMWFNGQGYYHVPLLHGSARVGFTGYRNWQPIQSATWVGLPPLLSNPAHQFASMIAAVDAVRERIAGTMDAAMQRGRSDDPYFYESPERREARYAAARFGERGASVFTASASDARLQDLFFGDDPDAPQIFKGQDFPQQPSTEQLDVVHSAIAWMDGANIGRRDPPQPALTRLLHLNTFTYQQQGAQYEAVMVTCVVSHDNPRFQDLHHIVGVREVGTTGAYQLLPRISDAGNFIGDQIFRKTAMEFNISIMMGQRAAREQQQKKAREAIGARLDINQRLFCAAGSSELVLISDPADPVARFAGSFVVDERFNPDRPRIDFGPEIDQALANISPGCEQRHIKAMTDVLRRLPSLPPMLPAEMTRRGFTIGGTFPMPRYYSGNPNELPHIAPIAPPDVWSAITQLTPGAPPERVAAANKALNAMPAPITLALRQEAAARGFAIAGQTPDFGAGRIRGNMSPEELPHLVSLGADINAAMRNMTPVSSRAHVEAMTKAVNAPMSQSVRDAVRIELRARGFMLSGGELIPFGPNQQRTMKRMQEIREEIIKREALIEETRKHDRNSSGRYFAAQLNVLEKQHIASLAAERQEIVEMVLAAGISSANEDQIFSMIIPTPTSIRLTVENLQQVRQLMGDGNRTPYVVSHSLVPPPRPIFSMYMTTFIIPPGGRPTEFRIGRLRSPSDPPPAPMSPADWERGTAQTEQSSSGFYELSPGERKMAEAFGKAIFGTQPTDQIPPAFEAGINALIESRLAGTPEAAVHNILRDFGLLEPRSTPAAAAELQRRVLNEYEGSLPRGVQSPQTIANLRSIIQRVSQDFGPGDIDETAATQIADDICARLREPIFPPQPGTGGQDFMPPGVGMPPMPGFPPMGPQ